MLPEGLGCGVVSCTELHGLELGLFKSQDGGLGAVEMANPPPLLSSAVSEL